MVLRDRVVDWDRLDRAEDWDMMEPVVLTPPVELRRESVSILPASCVALVE